MTWEIALGIFALVSFVAIIIGWTTQITSTLSKLNTSVDNLNDTVKEFKDVQNALSVHLGEHDITLTKHDERIKTLEKQIDSEK